MCSLQEHIQRDIRARQQETAEKENSAANECDTGTPERPCRGCPDCMGIVGETGIL